MTKLFASCILILIGTLSFAQETDTLRVSTSEDAVLYGEADNIGNITSVDSTHSPRLAALYSAVLPGAGQFYNEKYWKIPIVYALGAFAAYQIKSNHQNYMLFRNVYFNLNDGDPTNNDDLQIFLDRGFTDTSINRRLEAYKRDRDYWIILAGVFYVLNIVDATVDAHLREFNLNDNLSMRIEPSIQQNPYSNMQAGVMLNFRVKGKNTN